MYTNDIYISPPPLFDLFSLSPSISPPPPRSGDPAVLLRGVREYLPGLHQGRVSGPDVKALS